MKRNESPDVSEIQKAVTGYPNAVDKPNSGIENFLASLNISKENELPSSHHGEPPNEEHLSPQSFAMKGTRMLKEILKIDSSNTVDHKKEMKRYGNEVIISSNRRDEYGLSSQPKQSKKLAPYMNKPHSASEYHGIPSVDSMCWPVPVPTPVTELGRICSLVGMPQPDFSFLRTPQTMTVCQVKLSNGLLVHGPQCHSENEAKEKAALFALQQLSSLGVNFPLPPPIFPNYPPAIPPGTIPPVFPQPTANIMPSSSHLFGSIPWGPPVPVAGTPFHQTPYPGAVPMTGGTPGGTHNQFIPLQVMKKRVANKKNFENKETQSSSQANPAQTSRPGSSDMTKVAAQESASASSNSSQVAQAASSFQGEAASQGGHNASHRKAAPSSSSRRKSRKLAVNFGVSKPSE